MTDKYFDAEYAEAYFDECMILKKEVAKLRAVLERARGFLQTNSPIDAYDVIEAALNEDGGKKAQRRIRQAPLIEQMAVAYATEIEELRDRLGEALVRENNLLAKNADLDGRLFGACKTIKGLIHERDKVRAALERIADENWSPKLTAIAREALANEETK